MVRWTKGGNKGWVERGICKQGTAGRIAAIPRLRALEPASTVSVRLVPATSFLTVSCSIRVSPFTCAHPEAFARGETLISNNSTTVFLQIAPNVKLFTTKTQLMTYT